ncbi:uncharacterized protein LOC124302740 [Neodiprion virginianus]|uniref:uncharacterized protein LOC124302740 n=1 Tax=Neodiprion virginianus TaxID=2961670 RepID=UPI001EE6CA26|nr:uncharacterized protein LOC124302740 [Neodiprion virginianus]
MDESSSSLDFSLHNANPQDFTLEDTLGVLMDLKSERDQELEQLYDVQINNKLFDSIDESRISEKRRQYVSSFIKQISNDKPDDYPIPNTLDMVSTTVAALTQEVQNAQEQVKILTENLERTEKEISRLKEKKQGIEKMKNSCLAANNIIASKTWAEELRITQQIFKEVKQETQQVVAEIFPDNDHVKNFLAELCSAYFSSGDNVYVDLLPEVADAANFLLEADLIVRHRYDENKVRLIDLYVILNYFHLRLTPDTLVYIPTQHKSLNTKFSLNSNGQ